MAIEDIATEGLSMEGFYTRFLGRDLVHILSGILFYLIIDYGGMKINFPQELSLNLIGFLIISYITGVIFDEIGSKIILSLKKIDLKKHITGFICVYAPPYDYKCDFVILQDLIDNYDNRIINQFDRLEFNRTLGASFSTSFLLGAIIMFLTTLYDMINSNITFIYKFWLAIILIMIGIFMRYYGRKAYIAYHVEQQHLVEGIQKRKSHQKS